MLSPEAEVLAESMLKDGAAPEDVRDLLYDKGYISEQSLSAALDILDRMALQMPRCHLCNDKPPVRDGCCESCIKDAEAEDARWDFETNSQDKLNQGICPHCSGKIKFTGEIAAPGYGKSYDCVACEKGFIQAHGWWYLTSCPELTEADVR